MPDVLRELLIVWDQAQIVNTLGLRNNSMAFRHPPRIQIATPQFAPNHANAKGNWRARRFSSAGQATGKPPDSVLKSLDYADAPKTVAARRKPLNFQRCLRADPKIAIGGKHIFFTEEDKRLRPQ